MQVVATPAALEFFDAAAIEQQTGNPVKSQYSKPGSPRSQVPDAIVVAPATYNTINKWANGISDTYALGILAETTGTSTPITVLPFVNSALASRAPFRRSVESLRSEGVKILLGPGQFEPHQPRTGGNRIEIYPWHLTLDEAERLLNPQPLRLRTRTQRNKQPLYGHHHSASHQSHPMTSTYETGETDKPMSTDHSWPAALNGILTRARALLIDFDGPVCSLFAGTPTAPIADHLRKVIAEDDLVLPQAIQATTNWFEILACAASISQSLGGRVEARLSELELAAVDTAVPTPYIHDVIAACRESGRSAAIISNNSAAAVRASSNATTYRARLQPSQLAPATTPFSSSPAAT